MADPRPTAEDFARRFLRLQAQARTGWGPGFGPGLSSKPLTNAVQVMPVSVAELEFLRELRRLLLEDVPHGS